MNLPFRPSTLRIRLALWYTAALAVVLLCYATLIYVAMSRTVWNELDERLHHEVETSEGLLQPYWTARGVVAPNGASVLDDDDERWLQVWSVDGAVLFESPVARQRPIPGLAAPDFNIARSWVDITGRAVRIKDERGHIAGSPVIVRVATEEDRQRKELGNILWYMAFGLPAFIAVAGYGGYRLASFALAPVQRLVDESTSITADHLSQRLPVDPRTAEVAQIARAFNQTLERLETSFNQLRTFTANASHELRTPLTVLRTTGQLALGHDANVSEQRDAIGSMLEEVERLTGIVDTMLLLARADAGQLRLERQPIDVAALVQSVVDQCLVLADEKQQHVELQVASGTALVDPVVLRMAIANLVHNAIRYSPAGSTITIRATSQRDHWTIEFEDEGPGIAAEHRPHIFDRFYRADASRSSQPGGAGLGLPIARWAAEAHGGAITWRQNAGDGSTFCLTFRTQPPA